MLILQGAGFLLIAVLLSFVLALHDARRVGWHRAVGWRCLRGLITFDLALAAATYLVLTAAAGAGWHLLATRGVVQPRSKTDLGMPVLAAITAGVSSLAVLQVRLPRGERRAITKRLESLRAEQVAHVRSTGARHQTEDHVTTVLPGLKEAQASGKLKPQVKAWHLAAGLSSKDGTRLCKLAASSDEDDLLTLAAEMCNVHAARPTLDYIIGRGPKPIRSRRQRNPSQQPDPMSAADPDNEGQDTAS